MDNNTTSPATDDLTVADAMKIVAVEAAKAAVIATVQVTAAYAGLAVIGFTAVKIQERREAKKKAAAAIETTPEND